MKTALKTMAQVLGDTANIAGGTSGAVQTDFPTSVNNVFQNPPKAAMVIEGDFVPGVATVKAKPGVGLRRVPVPVDQRLAAVGRDRRRHDRHVQGHAGDPGVREVPRHARPRPTVWATQRRLRDRQQEHAGERLPGRDHAHDRRRRSRRRRTSSSTCPTSSPASFGATVGQGEWGIFQDFLRNPKDVTGIQKKLESAASAAYKKGK